ncbi:MAG: RHS repeat-associated core domain-containing protein, partial [Acidimicrobiales bacterium]
DGTTDYVYGPNGLPLEQIDSSGRVFYYLHDQLGSTRALTDSSGAVVATYTYGPYGQLASSSGSVTNPFRFAGQYQDGESGLYYLRNRYYDPTTAQSMSVDPALGATGSAYGYVGDNPLNTVDPSGLWGWNLISDVSQAAGDVGGYVARHKVITGIALGVVGVASGGAGFLVEGAVAATVLSATAAATGGAAAYLDTGPCLHGNNVACVAAALGWTSALAGIPSTIGLALGVSEESLPGSVLLGLLPGLAFNFGAGVLTTDFSLWLAGELNANVCSTK